MYTISPTSEYFDFGTFVDENISSLVSLYEQAAEQYKDLPSDSSEREDHIAIDMALAIFADKNELIYPMSYEDYGGVDADEVSELAEKLVILCALFSLERKGLAQSFKNSDGEYSFRHTEKGSQAYQELNTAGR